MTAEQVKSLDLGIAPINAYSTLLVESGLHWVLDNTTLKFDCNNDEELKALHPNVRLFVMRYVDIMGMSAGVVSESISGLSQTFVTGDTTALLWQNAQELLGKWLISRARFVGAQRRWR